MWQRTACGTILSGIIKENWFSLAMSLEGTTH